MSDSFDSGAPWKGGRLVGTPDCPPYRPNSLPDQWGDFGLSSSLCTQNSGLRRDKSGSSLMKALTRSDSSEPYAYRPPTGVILVKQSGMGGADTRFDKPMTAGAAPFRVGGSGPKRANRTTPSFAQTFAKFPDYKEDPWDDKIKAARARAAKYRAMQMADKVWKPTRRDFDYRTTKGTKEGPAFKPIYNCGSTTWWAGKGSIGSVNNPL